MAIPFFDAVMQTLETKHYYCRYRRQFINGIADEKDKADATRIFPEWEVFETFPIEEKEKLARALADVLESSLKEGRRTDIISKQDVNKIQNFYLKDADISPAKIHAAVEKALTENAPQKTLSRIKEGGFDALLSVRANQKDATDVDPITNALTISKNGVEIVLENFTDLKAFSTTTAKLAATVFEWAALIPFSALEHDNSEKKKPDLVIPISFFLERTGLANGQDVVRQINKDIKTLCAAKLTFTEKSIGKPYPYKYVNIFEAGGAEYGKINIRFSSIFFDLLQRYNAMPFDVRLYKTDTKKHSNSFEMGRRLYKHKFINYGRRNANCIPIKSILASCDYADADKNGRHYGRIIDRFTGDLEHLCDLGFLKEWTYAKNGGVVLSEQELVTAEDDYQKWQTLHISFVFPEYPALNKKTKAKPKKKEPKTGEKAQK